ncbi:hypothetical protein VAG18_002949 [Escherichia coli]|nr:hypothetical protein [Escherichia coli]
MLNTKLIDNLEKLSQPENYLWSASWVENWNRVAAKVKKSYTPFELQLSFIEEEFNEVLEELEKGDGGDHLLKEACDLHVVTSYAAYLVNDNYEKWTSLFDNSRDLKFKIGEFYDTLIAAKNTPKQRASAYRLAELSTALLFQLSGDVCGMMRKVLKSNDSKFARINHLRHSHGASADMPTEQLIELEIKDLERRFGGRYEGFVAKEEFYNGNKVIIFLDSKGKIMKPSSFKDVTEYI